MDQLNPKATCPSGARRDPHPRVRNLGPGPPHMPGTCARAGTRLALARHGSRTPSGGRRYHDRQERLLPLTSLGKALTCPAPPRSHARSPGNPSAVPSPGSAARTAGREKKKLRAQQAPTSGNFFSILTPSLSKILKIAPR